MMNHSRVADDLLNDFLQHIRTLGGDVEPVKVLRSNTYRVGNSHVLARVAADTGKYFFGLNYINAEEVANLAAILVDSRNEDMGGHLSGKLNDQFGKVGLNGTDTCCRQCLVEMDLVSGERLDLHHAIRADCLYDYLSGRGCR